MENVSMVDQQADGGGNGGDRGALEVFPVEVWRSMFDKLLNQLDVKGCAEASKELRNVLEKKRSQYMFADVMPIVISNVFPRLNKIDLLSMRLVCQAWKLGIDRCIEYNSRAHLQPFNSSTGTNQAIIIPRPLRNDMLSGHRFQTLAQINTFLRYLNENTTGQRAPLQLPFKFLEFHESQDQSDAFRQAAVNLLARVGAHLEHLTISNVFNYSFLPSLYLLLHHTPNLRSIHLSNIGGKGSNTPLPPLPHLEILTATSTHMDVINFIALNYRVPRVEVFQQDSNSLQRPLTTPNNINLKTLSVTVDNLLLTERSKVGKNKWQLKLDQLELLPSVIHTPTTASGQLGNPLMTSENLLKTLNGFGEWYMSLDLRAWNKVECLQCFFKTTPLALPHLKNLKCSVQAHLRESGPVNCLSYHFFKSMTSLKELEVEFLRNCCGNGRGVEGRVDIICSPQAGNLPYLPNNVWSVLPTLESISLKKQLLSLKLAGGWETVWATERFHRPSHLLGILEH